VSVQGVDTPGFMLMSDRVSFSREATTAKIGEDMALANTSRYVGDMTRYGEAITWLNSQNFLSPQ
jgi:hypothetical protein